MSSSSESHGTHDLNASGQNDAVSDERLREMLAGLEGLPAGPYSASDNEADLLDGNGRWLDTGLDHGSALWRHFARLDPQTVRSILSELLSLRAAKPAPEWQGMEPDRDSLRLMRQFADMYRSGDHGAEMDFDAAQSLALSIDDVLSAPPLHPNTGHSQMSVSDAVMASAMRLCAKTEAIYGFVDMRSPSAEEARTAWAKFAEEKAHLLTLATAARRAPSDGEAVAPFSASIPKHAKWCQPGDRQQHRMFIVRFDDQEMRDAVFEDEAEAREFYGRATVSWNCYLFGALDAHPAQSIEPVAVKALEWGDCAINRWEGFDIPLNHGLAVAYAKTGIGTYAVVKGSQGRFEAWLRNGQVSGSFTTKDEAKAAAQADFDQRIRSALSPQP